MKIIAVANNKGGVCKTTTVRNIGAALVELGNKVLLVDEDDQANLTYSLNGPEYSAHNICAFLLASPEKARSWPFLEVGTNLWLLPSSEESDELLEKLQSNRKRFLTALRERLEALPTGQFDYVIIDCPPSLTDGMTNAALIAADAFVVPVHPEPFAVRGLKRIMERAKKMRAQHNPRLQFLGFTFTQFNPEIRGQLRQQMYGAVRKKYGEDTILPHINQNAAVSEANAQRKSVLEHKTDSPGAKNYRKLTKTILTRIL